MFKKGECAMTVVLGFALIANLFPGRATAQQPSSTPQSGGVIPLGIPKKSGDEQAGLLVGPAHKLLPVPVYMKYDSIKQTRVPVGSRTIWLTSGENVQLFCGKDKPILTTKNGEMKSSDIETVKFGTLHFFPGSEKGTTGFMADEAYAAAIIDFCSN